MNTDYLSIYFILGYLSSVLKFSYTYFVSFIPNNLILRGTITGGNIFEIKVFTYLLLVYGKVTDFCITLSS